jgi:hypothetical protein
MQSSDAETKRGHAGNASWFARGQRVRQGD